MNGAGSLHQDSLWDPVGVVALLARGWLGGLPSSVFVPRGPGPGVFGPHIAVYPPGSGGGGPLEGPVLGEARWWSARGWKVQRHCVLMNLPNLCFLQRKS